MGIHPSYFTDHTYKPHPKSCVQSCTGCDYWLKRPDDQAIYTYTVNGFVFHVCTIQYTRGGRASQRMLCNVFPEKALQSPEGKAIKHRLIKTTVPPLHQFTLFSSHFYNTKIFY